MSDVPFSFPLAGLLPMATVTNGHSEYSYDANGGWNPSPSVAVGAVIPSTVPYTGPLQWNVTDPSGTVAGGIVP